MAINVRWRAIAASVLTSVLLTSNSSATFAQGFAKITFNPGTKDEVVIEGSKDHGMFIDHGKTTLFSMLPTGKALRISSDNVTVGYVDLADGPEEYKLKDRNKKLQYKLRKEPDGRYKFKGPDGAEICKLTPESYGFKIKDAKDQVRYKIHNTDGKVTLKSEDGKTVMEARADMPPIAMACFGFDPLSAPQKAALAFTFTYLGK